MKTTEIREGTLLTVFTTTRLVVSTAFRMVYPFLPAFSRGLGVTIETIAVAVSARSALGFFGPALGAVADIRGRKQALVVALVVFGISLGTIGLWPVYPVFFWGMVISGGATVIIDSSIHAYLGDKIPYARRGQAAAIVELGWSLAFVIGIPIVGWSITRLGWSSPFLWLGLAGIVSGGVIGLVIPRIPPSSENWQELKIGLRGIFSPVPLLGLVLAVLTVLANQVVSIVFGVWMENSFGLKIEQLGAASSVIGLAGITGIGCAILFTDRLGKRRAVAVGLVINSLACLVFPFLGAQLWGTLAMLFVFYLSFEFTLTSLLPMMTALSVQARGVFMAATLGSFSLGDSFGALLGPILINKGMFANAAAAITFNLVGLLLLVLFIHPIEKTETTAG
jgi:predicted MFS family arabinose efflux permease